MPRDWGGGLGVLALATTPEGGAAGERPPRVLPVIGVGILARVDRLPDGRFNIVLRGAARARIARGLPSGEPYRLVRAEPLLPARPPPPAAPTSHSLNPLVPPLAPAHHGPHMHTLVPLAARHLS